MNKIRLGVIYGGKSGEHEVSIMSADSVINAIDTEKYDITRIFISKEGWWTIAGQPLNPWDLRSYIDFALPILHGPNGEDGTVQGLLKLAGMPYGGCDVLGCSVTMDKIVAKKVFASEGLRQAPYIAFTDADPVEDVIEKACSELRFPMFVKPSNMGSSVGITKAHDRDELKDAIALAAKYDSRLLIEQGIDAREIESAVMGNNVLVCGEVGEIVPGAEFYDYNDKYFDGNSQLLIPAPITEAQKKEVLNMAKRAYKACGCSGFSRVDFLMDKATGEIYINEINAIPGFTKISMFPRLMMAAGMKYPEIIDRIVELGYERHHAEDHR
ncbi:MAG: D-alanine--D-alanine ligase [Firmicutes bacterium]|nr:D-alanine--D-alanine ligase [Bacillota bacterium]MBR0050790.1 D-alanine--D-alanine ligase [Bacillota bacterium]